jgi:hypothetical protein
MKDDIDLEDMDKQELQETLEQAKTQLEEELRGATNSPA